MQASTRIIANTLSSYARLCVLALVGILATPVALHILGAIDYGIFSVIGGSLAFLMFINLALTTGAQRHIAFALGEGRKDEAAKWFAASLAVHIALSVVIATVATLLSHWISSVSCTFPANRLGAAVWIYRLVVAAMVLNVVSTPFQALMMAYESIVVLSMISIGSALSTITGVLSLKYLPGDKLVWYAVIYSCSQMVLFISPIIYSYFRYEESRRFSLTGIKRSDIRELVTFSGWNLFGTLAAVIRSQGPAILFNIFEGPSVNAAYGLSIQVNGFSSEISWGVLRATTSPIVKRHAAGDREGMVKLANLANKYAFFILWIAIAPVIFDVGFCLRLWLRHGVPPHTAAFVSILLITLLTDQLTCGFLAALQAVGKIAAASMIVGGTSCLAVPVGYLLLRAGMPMNSVLWCGTGAIALAGLCRLKLAQVVAKIPISAWLRNVALPCFASAAGSSLAMLLVLHSMKDGALRFAVIVLVNALAGCAIMWNIGVTRDHQTKLLSLLSQTTRRVTGMMPFMDRASS